MNTDFQVLNEPNYAAEVVRVNELVDLPGLDNLKGLPVGGYTALVSKETTPGTLLVVFPAEAQLSHEFARDNNLYSNPELNADTTQKGYLGKNRRVRAIRLRGHLSSALALNADVLSRYTDCLPEEGDVFDTIRGVELSRKYELPRKPQTQAQSKVERAWKRVDAKFLPEHFDTAQYWRESDRLAPGDHVTVTQKLHGTSVRIGHVPVKRQLNWLARLAKRLGVPVSEWGTDIIGGSRKVIKDPGNPNQNHFYETDLWTEAARKYGHLLPENVILYGELIGWAGPETPIQPNYTYNVPQGENHLYVYRVTVVAPDGGTYDLSWEGVREFCESRGLDVVPTLWSGRAGDFDPDDWTDRRYRDAGYLNAVPLWSDSKIVDEGVCIRREGVVPFVLKSKSPKFFEHETAMLDEGKEVLS